MALDAGQSGHLTDHQNGVYTVSHGATAGTARPTLGSESTAPTVVLWVGSVTPSNAVDGDQWWDTTNRILKVRVSGSFVGVGQSGLLSHVSYDPVGDTTYTTTSSSFADVDATNLLLPDFTVPPSGRVVVLMTAWVRSGVSSGLSFNVRSGAGNVSDSDVRVMQMAGGGDDIILRQTVRVLLTGLSGTKTGWRWGFARHSGTTACNVYVGPTYGPAHMEVWAA